MMGVEVLRALAHPLRMRILGSLRIDGPATSAMLARRLATAPAEPVTTCGC